MGDLVHCKRCSDYHWGACPANPFVCRLKHDDEDDTSEIWARDADSAAQQYLVYCMGNRDGWEWIKEGESYRVIVIDARQSRSEWWVTAHLEWSYSSREINPPHAASPAQSEGETQ